MNKPAILGGEPVFANTVPITKPTLPETDTLVSDVSKILSSGMITNSDYVKKFELECASYAGVKHCIAVSSCTSGIMLVMKALGLSGEVILPSFTFSATGHALVWNGLTPVFVDCDRETYNIDTQAVVESITPKTSAILAVHIFGNPCDIRALERIASEHNLKLVFDSAHCFGSLYNGLHIGCFGDAEVFSCSPTKLLTTGEGGLVMTSDDELRGKIIIGRNYGDPGNYDCKFSGLNARMSEFNAVLGLKSLEMIERNVTQRNNLANLYKKELSSLHGIKFQKIMPNCRTTFKDFSIEIEPEEFGLNRDELSLALDMENIMTRKYFYPPLHKQTAFSHLSKDYDGKLPVTDEVSSKVLSLPMYSHMPEEYVEKISLAIRKIQKNAAAVRVKTQRNG